MKKRNIILIIVGCVIAYLVISILPIFLLFIIPILNSSPLEYKKISDNEINITSLNVDVLIEDSFYNKEDKCFYIKSKIEKNKSNKKIKVDELEIIYTIKDKDNYVIGEARIYIDEFGKHDKWKSSGSYCDINAEDANTYEIKEIYKY